MTWDAEEIKTYLHFWPQRPEVTLRSPRVISSMMTSVGWPWDTTPSKRTCEERHSEKLSG